MARPRFVQLLFVAACAALASAPRLAHAQNPAAAEALFEQARAAMAAGSYDIACARFRDSDKLDPAVGTRFNLADCEEHRGRIATAWSLFRGVLSELAQDDDRRPIAERRAKTLEPRLPYLTLVRTADTPPGVRVRVDGVELGEGSFGVPLPMDPGAHDLTLLLARDAQEQNSSFALKEGEHRDLPIQPGALAAAGESADAPLLSADSGRTKRKWGYVAGGVGAAGIAFGAVTGIVTLSKKSTANANCSDDRRVCNQVGKDANDSGKTFGTLSAVGLSVGVVGLAAGAYLLLTAPAAPPDGAHSSLRVRRAVAVNPELSVTESAGFLAVSGSF